MMNIMLQNNAIFNKMKLFPVIVDLYPENKNSDKINIVMKQSTGLKMIMSTPGDIPIKDIIRKYLEKIQVQEQILYDELGLIFLFQGMKLDINSDKPISSVCKGNINEITVIYGRSLIGA